MLTCQMVMVQRLSHAYVPKDHDIVEVPRVRLARMSELITVECEVAGRLFRAELVGYREADTGCVMVTYEQFNENFS